MQATAEHVYLTFQMLGKSTNMCSPHSHSQDEVLVLTHTGNESILGKSTNSMCWQTDSIVSLKGRLHACVVMSAVANNGMCAKVMWSGECVLWCQSRSSLSNARKMYNMCTWGDLIGNCSLA